MARGPQILSADTSLDVVILVNDEADVIGDRTLTLNPGAKRQFFAQTTPTS